MSENGSNSSLPTSPVTAVPDLPNIRTNRTAWDPESRKSGPGSVLSETTEGYGDYYASTTNLPFSFSSASLSLSAVPQEWSSAKHGFHAISTVVNSPHKRSAPPKTHSAIAVVTPTVLPKPNRKILDQYVQTISPEWERFQRSSQLGLEGAAQVEGSSGSPEPPRGPRPFVGKQLPELTTIPSVFFDLQFNLGDPHTFNAVTDQEDGSEISDPSSLSHSLPLLEKLSHYADTIEQHLIREISLRSTSFFAALSNLQDLQTESEQCIDRIAHLRTMLKEVDNKNAKQGLEIIRMEGKLRNLESVKEGVRVVAGVIEMSGVAKGLAAAGQWGEALGVVEELQALWEEGSTNSSSSSGQIDANNNPIKPSLGGQLSPVQESHVAERVEAATTQNQVYRVSLSTLHAFSSLPVHLQSLTMEIASSLTNELVNVLRVDLAERISGSSHHDSLSQTLTDRLRPSLQGLLRTRGLRQATLFWRDTALGVVRGCIKLHLPMFDTEDDETLPANSDQGAGLAGYLHSLGHTDFMVLIRSVYTSLLNGVEGLQAQNNLFLGVLEAIRPDDALIDMPALREELSDVLSSAAELSNLRASTIVSLRSEQHIALPLPDFLNLFNDSWNFVLKCEIICQRMIVGLRGVIVSQAKAFLQAFHQDHISHSAKFVEDEQWSPVEVPPVMQRTIQVLIDSAVRDPPELLVDPPPIPITPLTNGNTTLGKPISPSRTSKHVKIEDRTYFAVSATLESLHLLVDYLRVIANLSMLTTDAMSRVIEFFKSFNSRTCQVVLGAGAMRSAGLKNITAKHLALASQSLSIMIALIPYVRESFRRHLSEKQAVMLIEFDKLKRDYQEHQNEIHAKLIAIMGDRLTAHIRTLQAINWAAPLTKPGANDYMDVLVKETVTLHKVLSRYLSVSVVEYVMAQVFAAINHGLAIEYAALELPDQEAKDRLFADAKYLHDKLSTLRNVAGASTGMLMTVVSEKPTTSQPVRTSRIMGILSRQNNAAKEQEYPSTPLLKDNIPPSREPTPRPISASVVQSPSISTTIVEKPIELPSSLLPAVGESFSNGQTRQENGVSNHAEGSPGGLRDSK